ncbi:hypothetical protein [Haloferax sp. YSSS75]|uniref:hypothetical protein n=1 Tax=Haloferax sp. YSSS75 TaxID=3388564 RepID=UPI00398D0DAD
MTTNTNTNPTETNSTETNWDVTYDADPIYIRDPVAEALCVLEPGEPFVVTYEDVVKAAGHSCPTAAGAFRIAQVGLDTLYDDERPVRSDVEVVAAGPEDDPTYGVTTRLLSYITGAAGVDGFGGLGGGYGGRKNLLTYDGFDAESADPTFRLRRTDTGETVEVRYHVGGIPGGGPALGNLQSILEGMATDDERAAFGESWHRRVQSVLSDDRLFSVRNVTTD